MSSFNARAVIDRHNVGRPRDCLLRGGKSPTFTASVKKDIGLMGCRRLFLTPSESGGKDRSKYVEKGHQVFHAGC